MRSGVEIATTAMLVAGEVKKPAVVTPVNPASAKKRQARGK